MCPQFFEMNVSVMMKILISEIVVINKMWCQTCINYIRSYVLRIYVNKMLTFMNSLLEAECFGSLGTDLCGKNLRRQSPWNGNN